MGGNLICSYSANSAIDISGTALAFKEFAKTLSNFNASYNFFIPSGSPKPYESFLEKISIEEGNEKLKITVKGKTLVCLGDKKFLRVFLNNILSFSEEEYSQGMHNHIEYFEDHFFLDPASEGLVISRTS